MGKAKEAGMECHFKQGDEGRTHVEGLNEVKKGVLKGSRGRVFQVRERTYAEVLDESVSLV